MKHAPVVARLAAAVAMAGSVMAGSVMAGSVMAGSVNTALPAASPSQIVATAPASAWRTVAPDNLLLLAFADGAKVAIELAPAFAPQHVDNIRKLVRDGWFGRHAAITRVQENYVVQWGAAGEAPLPATIIARPEGSYERQGLPPGFRPLPYRDAYARRIGHADGWPVASDGKQSWLTHCPAMVGVGRDMAPDTGTGAELYAVIGHGPRHLDRNIALVGRVLEGMEQLSALPRGSGPLGTYTDQKQHVKLLSARMAGDLPKTEQPVFEVMRSDTPVFGQWVQARANRHDDFFIRPAGAADLCNLMPPVRRVK